MKLLDWDLERRRESLPNDRIPQNVGQDPCDPDIPRETRESEDVIPAEARAHYGNTYTLDSHLRGSDSRISATHGEGEENRRDRRDPDLQSTIYYFRALRDVRIAGILTYKDCKHVRFRVTP